MSDQSVEQRADHGRRPIDVAWASIALLVPMLIALLPRMATVDLAYHLRAGEEILRTHAIPSSDTYTFTVTGTTWADQQWGAQLLLWLGYRAGGWSLLLGLRAALVGATFFLLYLACRGRGVSPRTAALLATLSFLVAAPTLAMRPQLLVLPLFTGALWAISTRDAHPGRMWLLPVFAAVCANIHGSFVLYPLLAGLSWIQDVSRRSPLARRGALVVVATAAATLLNPFGAGVWIYAFDLSTNPVIREAITEWAPVTLSGVIGAFTFGSVIAVVIVMARRNERVPWTTLLWLGVFFLMAMGAIRAIVWWALVATVVVADLLPDATPARGRRREGGVPAIVIVATLAAAVVLFLPWVRPGDVALGDAPQNMTAAVEKLPAGTRLFIHQTWASWFEFTIPTDPVFADSRIEIYPASIWDDYDQVAFAGAGWKDVLDRWRPDAIVAEASWDLIPYLKRDPAWTVAYEDEDGTLFVRAG